MICTVAGTGIAGDGADGLAALTTRLYLPQDVTIGPDGRLYIVDWNNHRIRVRQDDGTLKIVAGIGELAPALGRPGHGPAQPPDRRDLRPAGRLVIAAWHNSRIKTMDAATGELIDVCGTGQRGFAGDGGPAAEAVLNLPVAVVFDPGGQHADLRSGEQSHPQGRRGHADISTFAGVGSAWTRPRAPLGDGGPATGAFISLPQGQSARPAGRIDVDAAGNLYLADTLNNRVRKIDTAGVITTVAGNGQLGATGDGGPATRGELSGPADVAIGPDGIYIADTGNDCVRVVRDDGIIAHRRRHLRHRRDSPATTAPRQARGSTGRAASRSTRLETCTSRIRTTSASASFTAEPKPEGATMTRHKTLKMFALAATALVAGGAAPGVGPRTAQACGGLFCGGPPPDPFAPLPVAQSGENIVFALDNPGTGETTVTAYIQILYSGTASDFSWVLPIDAVPDDLRRDRPGVHAGGAADAADVRGHHRHRRRVQDRRALHGRPDRGRRHRQRRLQRHRRRRRERQRHLPRRRRPLQRGRVALDDQRGSADVAG